jgi:hypothetical protein
MSCNIDVRNGPVSVSWFKGGTTNLAYNCLDRNVERGLGDKPCLIWEGNEPGALPCAPFSLNVLIRRLIVRHPEPAVNRYVDGPHLVWSKTDQ